MLTTIRFIVLSVQRTVVQLLTLVSQMVSTTAHGSMSIVMTMLGRPVFGTNITNHITRDTALTAAARAGHTEVVRELLKDGRIDPNGINRYGQTALMEAASLGPDLAAEGHTEIVTELLRDGRIDPNISDNEGCTALIWAAKLKSKDIQLALLRDRRVNWLTAEDLSRLSQSQREFYKNVNEQRSKRLFKGLGKTGIVFKKMRLKAAERVYAPDGEGFLEVARSFDESRELLQRQAATQLGSLGAESTGYQDENQPESSAASQCKECASGPNVNRTMP